MTADLASALRGYGPLALLSFAAIMLTGHYLGAALALVWCGITETPWDTIGLKRPARPFRTLVAGVVCGVLLKLAMNVRVSGRELRRPRAAHGHPRGLRRHRRDPDLQGMGRRGGAGDPTLRARPAI